jgi:hypothetical protein
MALAHAARRRAASKTNQAMSKQKNKTNLKIEQAYYYAMKELR